MPKLLNMSLIIVIAVILLDAALSAGENKNKNKNNSLPASTTTHQTTPTSTTPLAAVTVNCTSSNTAECSSDKKASSRSGHNSESDDPDSTLIMQGFYVVIGITVLAIGYFVFRAIKLRRRAKQGAVGRRLRRENVEMQRLTDEQFDDEDDAVLYDRTTSTHPPK